MSACTTHADLLHTPSLFDASPVLVCCKVTTGHVAGNNVKPPINRPEDDNEHDLAKVADGIKASFEFLDIPMPTEWTSVFEELAGADSTNLL